MGDGFNIVMRVEWWVVLLFGKMLILKSGGGDISSQWVLGCFGRGLFPGSETKVQIYLVKVDNKKNTEDPATRLEQVVKKVFSTTRVGLRVLTISHETWYCVRFTIKQHIQQAKPIATTTKDS